MPSKGSKGVQLVKEKQTCIAAYAIVLPVTLFSPFRSAWPFFDFVTAELFLRAERGEIKRWRHVYLCGRR